MEPSAPDVAPPQLEWSRAIALALIVVLAWSGLLRLTGITRARLLLCDESFYLMEARRIVGQARACKRIYEIFRRDRPAGLIHLSPADRAEVEALVAEGYGQLGGRFGHDLLLAGALSLGLPDEWCGQLVGALFGLATVLLIAGFSASRWGPRAALFAAVFLGGSILHLAYSRSALCESDCVFFIVAAVLAYASGLEAAPGTSRVLWFVTAGLSFGAAFVCNVRALPVAYSLVLFEAMLLAPRESFKRLVTFAAAAAVPLAVAESLYHVVFLFSGATGVLLCRQTYVHTLAWQFFRLSGGVMEPGANPGHYPRYLFAVENPLLLIAFGCGLAYLMWRARTRTVERLLAVVSIGVGLYWQLAVGIKCMRYLAPLLPLIAMGAGLAVARLLERRAAPDAATLAAALGMVAACSVAWSPWQGETPGYREAAEWLATQGRPRIVATQANYFRLRFPTADVAVASDLTHLREAHKNGFRWYVDCFQKYHWPILPDLLAIRDELAKRARPVEFAQPMAATPFTWFEGGHATIRPEWNEDARTIKVWDLDQVFSRP